LKWLAIAFGVVLLGSTTDPRDSIEHPDLTG
jgi:hypothetical protein